MDKYIKCIFNTKKMNINHIVHIYNINSCCTYVPIINSANYMYVILSTIATTVPFFVGMLHNEHQEGMRNIIFILFVPVCINT